jgi:hypothetical protein
VVGLAFVWNTIRDCDMVTIGTTTPDESRESIAISLDLVNRRIPDNELQKTCSKNSLKNTLDRKGTPPETGSPAQNAGQAADPSTSSGQAAAPSHTTAVVFQKEFDKVDKQHAHVMDEKPGASRSRFHLYRKGAGVMRS